MAHIKQDRGEETDFPLLSPFPQLLAKGVIFKIALAVYLGTRHSRRKMRGNATLKLLFFI